MPVPIQSKALRHSALWLALSVTLLDCTRAPHEGADAGLAAEDLRDFSGCSAVPSNRVCELTGERTLRIWLDSRSAADAKIDTDAGPVLAITTRDVEGGRRFHFTVPPKASRVRVRFKADGAAKELSLRVADPSPLPESLKRARDLRQRERLNDAEALLREHIGEMSGAARALATGLLARIDLAQGNAEAAERLFVESIALHVAAGRTSDAAEDSFALVFTRIRAGRLAAARDALARAETLSASYPDGRAYIAYYAGSIAREEGNLRLAMRSLRTAEQAANRLGLVRVIPMARRWYAGALTRLGRAEEAIAMLVRTKQELDPAVSVCERADLASDIGWNALLALGAAHDDEHATRFDPGPPLEEALAVYDAECPNPRRRAGVLANLARAALSEGNRDRARERLAQSNEADPKGDASLRLDRLDLEARIALASHAPESALGAFERSLQLARATGWTRDEAEALEGRAEALVALGGKADALLALAEAERLLESDASRVPLGEGRGSFLAARDDGTRLQIELFLGMGDAASAFEVARRAHARMLTALARSDILAPLDDAARARWEEALATYWRARDALDAAAANDWELSQRDLDHAAAERRVQYTRINAALDDATAGLTSGRLRDAGANGSSRRASMRDGEVLLAYRPLGDGWIGFAATRTRVRAVHLGRFTTDEPPNVLASKLLAPFAREIEAASDVTVLAYGRAGAIDFHALPWRAASLVDAVVVRYALGGGEAVAPAASGAKANALLVVDPDRTLPAARDEGHAVEAALKGTWTVQMLEGGKAEQHAVRALLTDATLLHFAGHGSFAGRDGVESALPLASESALTFGDILALERAPRFVILSACDGARAERETATGGLGLADAFLLAGTDTAIAAVRPVRDATAAQLMRELYAKLGDPSRADLGRALAMAQRALRRTEPSLDWAAFRALRR